MSKFRHLFVFMSLRHANLFVGRSDVKINEVDLSTPCEVYFVKAPAVSRGERR